MKYELWYSESDNSGVLLYEGDSLWEHLKGPAARVIWTVEAETYDEALEKRDEFLKAGNWLTKDRPFSEDELRAAGLAFRSEDRPGGETPAVAAGPTTRITVGMYLDEDGKEQTLEVPGWVGMVPHFLAANIDFTQALGQLYIERPYPNLESAPPMFTIVNLRSANGAERMLQEFAGKLEDAAEIRDLVRQRLGPEMPRWTIVTVHCMAKTPRPSDDRNDA